MGVPDGNSRHIADGGDGRNRRRRIVIVESRSAGHRYYYVGLLLARCLANGDEVTLLLSDVDDGSERAAFFPEASIDVLRLEDFSVGALAARSRDLRADLVVIPDADTYVRGLLTTLGWRGSGRLSLLIMRENSQKGPRFLRQLATLVRRTSLDVLRFLPRTHVAILKSAFWEGRSRFRIAPDPVTLDASRDKAAALRNEWKLDSALLWLGVLGAITARKNLDLVIESFARCDPSRFGLLVAGRVDPNVRAATASRIDELRANGYRIKVIDRLLTDREIDAAVSAIDCLVLAHSNEGPSGLLGKAAAAGTRTVAAGAKSLEEDVVRIPQLAVWVPLKVAPLAEALQSSASRGRGESHAADGLAKFVTTLLLTDLHGKTHDQLESEVENDGIV